MTITLTHALRGLLALCLIAATVPSLASDIVTRNVRCYGLDPMPEPKVQEGVAKADGTKAAEAAEADRTEAKTKPKRKPYRTMTTASCAAAGGSLGPSR